MKVGRKRAWEIIVEVTDKKSWSHWFRHQRLSHLASRMDPYQLAEFAHWVDIRPALKYVHRERGSMIEAIKKADEDWTLKP